jgi:hypothetical protein
MNKKHIIIFSLLILTIGVVGFNYIGQLNLLLAEATAPNPGHSWDEMECTTELCVGTNIGIGTVSPEYNLDILGNVRVTGNIIANEPIEDNHVATKNYVDGKITPGVPSGAIMMFKTACPSGWTRETSLDDRYAIGSTSYGTTGVGGSHTHGIPTGSVGVDSTTATANIPYVTVIWCIKN